MDNILDPSTLSKSVMTPMVQSPLVQGYYYDSDGVLWYEPDYNWDNYYYYDGNNNDFSWDEVEEGLPEYDSKDLEGDDSVWDWISYYKYLIDIFVIAIPYSIIGLLCVIYNFYFNINWNRKWASGNFWLIGNTVFLLVEYIISLFEAVELPIFMRSFKTLRFFATLFAALYIFLYLCGAFEWYNMLYFVTDKENFDFMTVYVNMLLGYNILLHWSVIPVCLFIILKEISMEFFQFLNPEAGKDDDVVSLNSNDWDTTIWDLLWFINPFTWLGIVWTILTYIV